MTELKPIQAQAKEAADLLAGTIITCARMNGKTIRAMKINNAIDLLRRIERWELIEKPKLRYGCVGSYRCYSCEKSGRRKSDANG